MVSHARQVGLLLLFVSVAGAAQPTMVRPDASHDFFKQKTIPHLKIEITRDNLDKLKQKDREYVRCIVVENGKTRYEDVGIHLKGAAGSFRGLDDRPALTLNFNKFTKQRFHDLDKIHLNNSVQDPSYLQELICSELSLASKVPTPRTGHARVWLNGRDLGFYVLKEGFDATFIRRHFADNTGNLYDGGFLQDIDANLRKQSGRGPDDHSDLKTLTAACREPDLAKRWQRTNELLDVDSFVTFMALELMTCHWDGYCQQRNNYRIYFDPTSKKAFFFPHGMDQMFGDPDFPILHVPGTIVAHAVMTNPDWRQKYRDRLNELIPTFAPERLNPRIDEYVKRILPTLEAWNKDQARSFTDQAAGQKQRIAERYQRLQRQNAVPDPRPVKFNAASEALILGWEPRTESADAKLEKFGERAGMYTITCGPSGHCVASWRTKVILTAGKYRLEAAVRTKDVVGNNDSPGMGAGVRHSGVNRTNKLEGTNDWQILSHEFTIDQPQQEIELVAELRARAGQVWFKINGMKLVKVEK